MVLDAFVMAHLGFQPAVAVTTVTAQNSSAFLGQWPVAPETLVAQLDALLAEGEIACVKIGALGSAELAGALAEWLILAEVPVVVCDPVLASSSGGALVDIADEAVDALARASTVVTPNVAEALRLARLAPAGEAAEIESAVLRAARILAERWNCMVIATGLPSVSAAEAVDLIVRPDSEVDGVPHPLVPNVGDVRGTGCMLASALACQLARGLDVRDALAAAHSTVREMLGEARPIGR
ncbi:MAG: PfkB family carbohydrate kinase, partial [Actinomycetota bacterium]|nr:PfkB family carbohydrate kinase [Actinomycetota bacterium]